MSFSVSGCFSFSFSHISFIGSSVALVLFCAAIIVLLVIVVRSVVVLRNNLRDVLLQLFLFKNQAVLVPDEVGRLQIKSVFLKAALKQAQNVPVVGIGSESQTAAVIHELVEFGRLVRAQLINCDFLLLALDVVVLFRLGAAGKALPREGTAEEVQKYVSDRLEIVAARLLVANVSSERSITSGTR